MANILDYLDWRGDLTLAERGFNEVDNLLMAELCFWTSPGSFRRTFPPQFSCRMPCGNRRRGRRRRWACWCRSKSRN